MLEKMDAFFAARLGGYDVHMMKEIDGAEEFYPYTASLLPAERGANVLDLGCGTGLELEFYFERNAQAFVTGIDLSREMLSACAAKLKDRNLELVCASYFDVPLGTGRFDAAVSVESLHHFTAAEKLRLYKRLRAALKENGYFVLTDYFAQSDEAEQVGFRELEKLRNEQKLKENVLYHFDTPLTAEHEAEILKNAGFRDVKLMKNWKATCTLLARR